MSDERIAEFVQRYVVLEMANVAAALEGLVQGTEISCHPRTAEGLSGVAFYLRQVAEMGRERLMELDQLGFLNEAQSVNKDQMSGRAGHLQLIG